MKNHDNGYYAIYWAKNATLDWLTEKNQKTNIFLYFELFQNVFIEKKYAIIGFWNSC